MCISLKFTIFFTLCVRIFQYASKKKVVLTGSVNQLSLVSIWALCVVDGLSQSLEYLGRWESLPVVGGLSRSLTGFHGR